MEFIRLKDALTAKRACRLLSSLIASVAVLIVLGTSFRLLTDESSDSLRTFLRPTQYPKGPFQSLIGNWRHAIHPLDNVTFEAGEGRVYSLSPEAKRWGKLGKKLLIVDIDTRFDTEEGALLSKMPLRIDNINARTAGYLNHYFYASVHGYDYRFVRAPDYQDRHNTWVKVPVIKEALSKYDFVVFLDSDAVFEHLEVPIEWLMSLWNVTDDTMAAMAEDPNSPINRDSKGHVLWNTGFIIASKGRDTREMFERWENCPTGKEYPECQRWANDWAHEQAAFGNFVRYEYDFSKDLRAISCMDGNGASYIYDKKCGGVFVSHHWENKQAPIADLFSNLDQDAVNVVHQEFLNNQKRLLLGLERALLSSQEGPLVKILLKSFIHKDFI